MQERPLISEQNNTIPRSTNTNMRNKANYGKFNQIKLQPAIIIAPLQLLSSVWLQIIRRMRK
jgi:hypothetical protein